MVGIRLFPFGKAFFQVRALSFREGNTIPGKELGSNIKTNTVSQTPLGAWNALGGLFDLSRTSAL